MFWASLAAQLVKNLPAVQKTRVPSLGQEDPWRRKWQPTPAPLPVESCEQRGLVAYSPSAHKSWTWHSIVTKPSPVVTGIEHLYIYLLIRCFSSLEKCVFRSSAHFKVRLFFFIIFILLTELLSYLYIRDYLLTGFKLNRHPLQCSRWTFHLLMVFFVVQMLCSFMWFGCLF